jgi:hypothetical protein
MKIERIGTWLCMRLHRHSAHVKLPTGDPHEHGQHALVEFRSILETRM